MKGSPGKETEHVKIVKNIQDTEASFNIFTYPSVDAVTIATFPSSLRLAAAVELILIALNVPKHNSAPRSVIFQAFFNYGSSRGTGNFFFHHSG